MLGSIRLSVRQRSNFWREVVDIKGSALPSAAKSKEMSLLSVHGVLSVCQIIARMQSIGF